MFILTGLYRIISFPTKWIAPHQWMRQITRTLGRWWKMQPGQLIGWWRWGLGLKKNTTSEIHIPRPSKGCQMVPFQGANLPSLKGFIGTPWKVLVGLLKSYMVKRNWCIVRQWGLIWLLHFQILGDTLNTIQNFRWKMTVVVSVYTHFLEH